MEKKIPKRSVLVAFGLVVLFTGINAIAVKYSEAEIPPFFGAAIRFAVAAIILFALVLVLRLPLPRGRNFVGAMIFGVLGSGISRALLYIALERLQAGLSMVLLALVPLLTFLLACIHKQETFRWKSLAGSFLAVGGIGVIVGGQLSTNLPVLPVLAVVGAAVCFAEATVVIKAFPQSHPITTNAIALSTGSVFLFILSALTRETPTLPSLATTWEALIYLILLGSVATFVLTVYVIKNWTASASSYQFVLFPIITIVLGAWLAHETMSKIVVIGGILVLAGVYIGGIVKTSQFKGIYSGLRSQLRSSSSEC
ncbi:MAG: EamA family transporter [Anaerolineales bacterium]